MPLVAQGPDYPSPDLSPDAILEKAGSVADMRYEGAKAAKALASLMGHPRWASLLTVAALRTTVPQSLADVRQVAPGRNRLQDHFDAGPPASTDLPTMPTIADNKKHCCVCSLQSKLASLHEMCLLPLSASDQLCTGTKNCQP